jgi:isopenicillin N synthase-like dioxygenase
MERKDSTQEDFLETLDFSRYTTGAQKDKAFLADQLAASLRRTGFVKLKNYGMDQSEIDGLFQLVR